LPFSYFFCSCPSIITTFFLLIPKYIHLFTRFHAGKRAGGSIGGVKDNREEGGEVRPDPDIEDEEIKETARSGELFVSHFSDASIVAALRV
jgi:hypothetical protein